MTFRYAKDFMLRFGQLYLLGAAVIRGIDYLIRPANSTASLTWIEAAMPLWAWGFLMISVGVMGLAGECWMEWGKSDKRWVLSWLAHVELAQAYALFGVSALIAAANQGYGFFYPVEMIGIALWHLIFVGRRKHA